MKKLSILIAAALITVLSAVAVYSGAQLTASGQAQGAAVSPEVKAVQDLTLAQELAMYGYQHGAPAALAVAAQIVLDTPAHDPKLEKQQKSISADTTQGQTKTASPLQELDPAKLLQEARALSEDNQIVLPMIDQLEKRLKEKSRGRVGGPSVWNETVNAWSTDLYQITFRAGEWAIVGVIGDGDTDLDLFIFDAWGDLVLSDQRVGDRCMVQWVPPYTQVYTIGIRNLGNVYNRYQAGTN